MTQFARILAVMMLIAAIAATGYAQGGAMGPDQMKMMGDHMRMMTDQMKAGKMTPDQMKMMGEHMQMMADRMKGGQMTPDEMKTMREHMQMMQEHMKGKKSRTGTSAGEWRRTGSCRRRWGPRRVAC